MLLHTSSTTAECGHNFPVQGKNTSVGSAWLGYLLCCSLMGSASKTALQDVPAILADTALPLPRARGLRALIPMTTQEAGGDSPSPLHSSGNRARDAYWESAPALCRRQNPSSRNGAPKPYTSPRRVSEDPPLPREERTRTDAWGPGRAPRRAARGGETAFSSTTRVWTEGADTYERLRKL